MQWTFESSATTQASPEAVWALWSDVATWPEWDDGIEHVTLDGPFAAGTTGALKPAGGPRVRFALTDVRAPHGFADVTRLPLCRMRVEHRLAAQDGGGTRITHRVTMHGPATPLFSRVIGRGLKKDLPDTVRSLARMAAERERVLAGAR